MPSLSPHISLTALAKVRSITVPDPTKPNSFVLYCDINLQKTGLLTIPVSKYFANGDVPPVGSHVFMVGPFWMLPTTDGAVDADSMEVVASDESLSFHLPSPSVVAIGTVAAVMGRDIHMDVGAYSREFRRIVMYQIIVTIPNDPHRAKMKIPQKGSNIAICGNLSYIALHEDVAAIQMEHISFLPRTEYSSSTDPLASARTKRQLVAEKAPTLDIGRPMKKTKSGPPEAFAPEELGTGSSTDASSSQSSVGVSSPSSVEGSSQDVAGDASSQSSVENSPPPAKNTRSAFKGEKPEVRKA